MVFTFMQLLRITEQMSLLINRYYLNSNYDYTRTEEVQIGRYPWKPK